MMTKLFKILKQRGLSQSDLFDMIEDSPNHQTIGKDRINRIVTGKQKNYTIQTAKTIAEVLVIKLDDFVE
jgi:transcriptional regulator with XRE-family HTH domain